jgi:hypothetical protein
VEGLNFAYLALKAIQSPFDFILDEDLVDGTVAADKKVVVMMSVDYVSEPVRHALSAFIEQGGMVLLSPDSELALEGAVRLAAKPELATRDRLAAIGEKLKDAALGAEEKEALQKERSSLSALRNWIEAARPLAKDLQRHLQAAGVAPVIECDEAGISATRQAAGDIEYLLAVNAAHDEKAEDPHLGVRAAEARISLPDDGRPVYDVTAGAPAKGFAKKGGKLTATFAFGTGDIRILARTTRPIGGVTVSAPALHHDYTVENAPYTARFAVSLLDADGSLLNAAVPLQLVVRDPAGAARYELFRATTAGAGTFVLPLALNDPAGRWSVEVTELVSGTRAVSSFELPAARACGAVAGRLRRAVVFGNDRYNVFRFFRLFKDVTIVTGTSAYNDEAAARLAASLAPWGVRSRVVPAAEVDKPRPITAEEAPTWCGIDYTPRGSIKPGRENPVGQVGFAVGGPVVLLGTSGDNPLIQFAEKRGMLPFAPGAAVMPGPGRGLIAWQLDAVGPAQESICVIAYDPAGMSEAVGSLYEAAAGLEAVTRLELPSRAMLRTADRP